MAKPSPALPDVGNVEAWSVKDMATYLKGGNTSSPRFFRGAMRLSEKEYRELIKSVGSTLYNLFGNEPLPALNGTSAYEERLQHERDLWNNNQQIFQRLHNSSKPRWFNANFFLHGRGFVFDHKDKIVYGHTLHAAFQAHCKQEYNRGIKKAEKAEEQHTATSVARSHAGAKSSGASVSRFESSGTDPRAVKRLKLNTPSPIRYSDVQPQSLNTTTHSLNIGMVLVSEQYLTLWKREMRCQGAYDEQGLIEDFGYVEGATVNWRMCPEKLKDEPLVFWQNRAGQRQGGTFDQYTFDTIYSNSFVHTQGDRTSSNVFLVQGREVFDVIPPELLRLHLVTDLITVHELD